MVAQNRVCFIWVVFGWLVGTAADSKQRDDPSQRSAVRYATVGAVFAHRETTTKNTHTSWKYACVIGIV